MKNNIVLIGMPGCGKTSIGKLVAKKLKLDFIDVDEYIEKENNMSIKDMFKYGESYFRNMETKAIKKISTEKNTVISTGGGVITKDINMKYLKENGIVLFIDRPLKNILSDINQYKRPLIQDDKYKLYELFQKRYPIYKKYSDHIIKNDKTLIDVIYAIESKIKNNTLSR
ncbi:shikimate kinase [Clostridiisalibacter paucivorans]|uniref:shikimate kinase n=1 Tax=Clostridiisalibacter paucivorans TaxID=408753 RepID=UPI00047AC25A|nr:shikimate kinase [Clostridiisalibacter paucivorans]